MATKYRRGSSWYIQWTDPHTGKQRRLSLGAVDKEAAERARKVKTLEVEVRADEPPPRYINNGKTLEEFWTEVYAPWHDIQYPSSRSKMEVAAKAILPILGKIYLRDLTARDIELWKMRRMTTRVNAGDGKLKTLAPETVRTNFAALRAALRAAVLWGELQHNPMDGVKPPPRGDDAMPKMLSSEQLAAIYREAGARAPWWAFLANTGLRRAEALRATRSDIRQTLDGKLVLAVESKATKGARTKSGKIRLVPLNSAAVAALQHLGKARLFPDVCKDVFSRHFRRAAQAAGIDATIHDLRHTFASHLASKGVPVVTIKELLGHSSINTTMIYMHYAPHTGAAAVEAIEL